MPTIKQAVVTVASGPFAEKLDYTFTSFTRNPFVNLHAFIVGERLPERQISGIQYHLRKPDPTFYHPMRDMYYRRLMFLDELEEDLVLLVDNSDVLCMQKLPEFQHLLRDCAFAGCVEHDGSRYIAGQGYTSCYVNAGVTFWNVQKSKELRREVVSRGRSRFRSVEDQLTLNEVLHTSFSDQFIILPSQYNYRPHFQFSKKGWPTVDHLNGVFIYHNSYCIRQAKEVMKVLPKAILEKLEPDQTTLNSRELFLRRVRHRFEKHKVK